MTKVFRYNDSKVPDLIHKAAEHFHTEPELLLVKRCFFPEALSAKQYAAWLLFEAGMSYENIGYALNCSKPNAWKLVLAWRKRSH